MRCQSAAAGQRFGALEDMARRRKGAAASKGGQEGLLLVITLACQLYVSP